MIKKATQYILIGILFDFVFSIIFSMVFYAGGIPNFSLQIIISILIPIFLGLILGETISFEKKSTLYCYSFSGLFFFGISILISLWFLLFNNQFRSDFFSTEILRHSFSILNMFFSNFSFISVFLLGYLLSTLNREKKLISAENTSKEMISSENNTQKSLNTEDISSEVTEKSLISAENTFKNMISSENNTQKSINTEDISSEMKPETLLSAENISKNMISSENNTQKSINTEDISSEVKPETLLSAENTFKKMISSEENPLQSIKTEEKSPSTEIKIPFSLLFIAILIEATLALITFSVVMGIFNQPLINPMIEMSPYIGLGLVIMLIMAYLCHRFINLRGKTKAFCIWSGILLMFFSLHLAVSTSSITYLLLRDYDLEYFLITNLIFFIFGGVQTLCVGLWLGNQINKLRQ